MSHLKIFRRDNGEVAKGGYGSKAWEAGNNYVVPYSPELLLKFNSHINVEIVSSVKVVKYLYKYLFKGFDRALVDVSMAV